MVRFIIAAVVLYSISIHAQSMNIQAGPGGFSIDVRESEAQVVHQPIIVHQPPPQQVVVVQQAAPPPERGMPAAEFRALRQSIKAEGFENQQLNVLQSAARRSQFTVEQVGQLIDLFDFSSGKVRVVEITRPRIVDRENLYQLFSHFTFDSDKEKVKHLLR